MRSHTWIRSIVLTGIALLSVGTANATIFERELGLPAEAESRRTTRKQGVQPGETVVLFDSNGPGCIRHWWLTLSHELPKDPQQKQNVHYFQIRFFYDGETEPTIDMTVAQFFSVMMDLNPYMIDNAAIKILPRNAYNCYLPIPFESLRIDLENTSPSNGIGLWFMADWHRYPQETQLTPLRLHAIFNKKSPAERYGSIEMADLTGRGFIAGMVQAVRVSDNSDKWFHTGGETFYLDGETRPNALRGIGGEDVFNMSFGIWPEQTDWIGTPFVESRGQDDASGSAYDGVMYRIFGPDPVWFQTSAKLNFNTKQNHTETLIYAYLDEKPAPEMLTPSSWHLAGPFPCGDMSDFERREWAEEPMETWPAEYRPEFGPYVSNYLQGPKVEAVFKVPTTLDSHHGWVDFIHAYRGRSRSNAGAQRSKVSAYAMGSVEVSEGGSYNLKIGYDDWAKVWLNGKPIYRGSHDSGFEVDTVPVELNQGRNDILLKLSNFDNFEWRLWAFNLSLEK